MELFKFPLPLLVEFLQMLITNGHIFLHLCSLDVSSEFILILDNIDFKQANLLHQVLVQLIFVDFAALLCEQLHLFFDNGEDHDLLVLIQNSIATLVKHINELSR